jgi:hypothetical protein
MAPAPPWPPAPVASTAASLGCATPASSQAINAKAINQADEVRRLVFQIIGVSKERSSRSLQHLCPRIGQKRDTK